jgi:hypothetical protein
MRCGGALLIRGPSSKLGVGPGSAKRRKRAASRPGHVVAYFASARFGGEAGHDLIRVS